MLSAAGPLMHGDVPLGEAVSFWILGPIALAGALGMVTFRNAVHSALSLAATMMCLGAMYMVEQGPFIGFVQIIVYTGAIMILFLFVLMLVGRDSSDSIVETLRGQRLGAALAGLAFALIVAIGVGRAFKGISPAGLSGSTATASAGATTGPNDGGNNVNAIADVIFTRYLFAFELTSALLIIAAVGAMVLAHMERDEPKPTQKQVARARIRGGRPQPWPGPGVLSSGDAIGTPALLPDGSASAESVLASTPGGMRELPGEPGEPEDYS
jgi:NADH-quinone oxidoreductase subunit J